MTNILDQIVENKRKEVEEQKSRVPLAQLQQSLAMKRSAVSLKTTLLQHSATGVIAEFKRKSPSKGWFHRDIGIADVIPAYEAYGACGVSILTDTIFFGSEAADLTEGRKLVSLPILRKDFIIDEYQVVEAKAIGADVILLIAACLSREEVCGLALLAKNLGLEVLLEVHNEQELEKVCESVDMVGVNNRDLKTFRVDIETSMTLVNKIPSSMVAVTESGISDIETIVSLKQAGFKGFLIGEQFMKHAQPAIAFAEFVKQLKAET